MDKTKPVQRIEVIRTYIETRGDGKSDPIRIIEQFWSMDGELLAENDPVLSNPK